MRIAIDTGGTFTDCVYLRDGIPTVLKVLSTPEDPGKSVIEAIDLILADMALRPSIGRAIQKNLEVRHGTTIGTNALLERKGARVAFVTTEGFEDTIAIGRQARQHLYDWMATPAPCIVPAELRFGVHERVSSAGAVLLSPTEQDLLQLRDWIKDSGAESIAVSLLFSFANPMNERTVATGLRETDVGGSALPISVSHEILPEFREYERAATVVVNAYLAPKAGEYVRRLESGIERKHGGSLYVMQSSGGIVSANIASREPVRTVLSGPAGGVIGAHRVARLAGFENIIGFDMGGTSTDVALIDAAGPKITSEARVSDIPISVPMLDIHTVGAGGGSVAWFDRGGILHVGPGSAGADPGPICYGRGELPTVTDANLALGRLDPELSLAGTVRLNEDRTRRFMECTRGAIASVEEFALGIVKLAEAEMEKAIRLISVERGYDPREFTLVCFGGAGPLHACALARALNIPRVMVPAMPGALSALGILMSDVVRDFSRTVMIAVEPSSSGSKAFNRKGRRVFAKGAKKSTIRAVTINDLSSILDPHFADLEDKAVGEFQDEGLVGIPVRSADLRYAGQGYEINVPAGPEMLRQFHEAHRRRYGHADETRKVEVVNVRVRMIAESERINFPPKAPRSMDSDRAIVKRRRVMFDEAWVDTPVFQRDLLMPGHKFGGPAIVHEYSATTVVASGCRVEVDDYSNLVIGV